MNRTFRISIAVIFVILSFSNAYAYQKEVAVVAPASEAAEGLDLAAVGELFKNSKDIEEFEAGLNDPKKGINNLDLDENGEVDFIRVLDEANGDTHVLVLQVPLGENEYQDVATVEIDKGDSDDYNFQLHGNADIYGPNYYVIPANVHVRTWPIVTWIYRPAYRPYISPFSYRVYPAWYRPFRPVSVTVYRTRSVNYVGRSTFNVARTTRVTSVSRTRYTSRSSSLVRKRTTTSVTRTTGPAGGKKTTVTRTKTTTRARGRRRP